jgi:hypothetical protein
MTQLSHRADIIELKAATAGQENKEPSNGSFIHFQSPRQNDFVTQRANALTLGFGSTAFLTLFELVPLYVICRCNGPSGLRNHRDGTSLGLSSLYT